jgi:heat shock protein HslJ
MKNRPILFWIVIGVAVFVCVAVGVYMALRVFVGNQESLPPTAILSPTAIFSPTSIPPTNTPLPSATRVVATVIPGLTYTATVAPSATSIPPTSKSSPTATVVSPTAKPSATATATTVPSATSVPPTVVPSATRVQPTPTVNPIQNIIWQWLSVTQKSTGVQTNIPNPGAYTIAFYPDGSLSGVADCNKFEGTYSQSNGFKINIGASTTVFCGEGSLDQEYKRLLSEVAAGGPDGSGNLALETAGGVERMVFANGGAAVKP